MSLKIVAERRVWNLLLVIHLIFYEIFFVYAVNNLKFSWYDAQSNVVFVLVWSLFLLLHVAVHFYTMGYTNASAAAQQSYREGFADAVSQMGDNSNVPKHFALDNDGEIIQLPEKRKRKR